MMPFLVPEMTASKSLMLRVTTEVRNGRNVTFRPGTLIGKKNKRCQFPVRKGLFPSLFTATEQGNS